MFRVFGVVGVGLREWPSREILGTTALNTTFKKKKFRLKQLYMWPGLSSCTVSLYTDHSDFPNTQTKKNLSPILHYWPLTCWGLQRFFSKLIQASGKLQVMVPKASVLKTLIFLRNNLCRWEFSCHRKWPKIGTLINKLHHILIFKSRQDCRSLNE